MAKIIKLDFEEVVIAEDDKNLIRIPYEELDFKPELNDEVDIYPDGESYIVTKRKNISNSTDEKININIVNDNQHQQPNNVNYIQSGKVVNKTVYIVLALFLGGIGGHKFYAGKIGMGILYFIFCLTFIPTVLAIIDIIVAATKTADSNGNIIL
ncbi:TM2 domain-containing protein [Enterococcus faecalis]|nr:TM2 domain-containing protein [Enterococcus faecalis]